MNFIFTEEQIQFKDAIKSFLAEECAPASIRDGWQKNKSFNLERWKNLIELGVLSSNLPEKKGGLGMDQVTLALMVEEMGYAGLPEPVAEQIFLVNDVIPFLPKNVTEAVESNFNDGTQYIALAHPLAPNPLFLNDAAGLILLDNSECKFIAKNDMDFEIISSNDPSRELFKVSSMNDAISTSKNFDELNSAVSSRGSLMTAALLIGLAQKMVDLSSIYVLDRTQFGKPIGSFQAVKHMLADVAVKIEFAKPAVYRAAYSLSENNPKSALHCAHAKLMCAQAAELACKNSIQAHGAMGYTWEMDLHIYMRKAWSMMACWGNEDKQLELIFKTLSSTSEELGVLYTF
ncbi:acyl-CoA dehydrogenase, C-terminal domain protein [SAR86 cluster bacterium SAR86E]|uniref:Acyl-CoA dehydrogenase, C-terminal domain protein n=1 Tax=SAR86 cluster bacterium SAR86E TaxID=1208365 RepID=K6GG19_9GAMM|nr:acyl-CoA dehydrogenase, C-terminal domain protein [SAR86 cluster bacterium SAR86E]